MTFCSYDFSWSDFLLVWFFWITDFSCSYTCERRPRMIFAHMIFTPMIFGSYDFRSYDFLLVWFFLVWFWKTGSYRSLPDMTPKKIIGADQVQKLKTTGSAQAGTRSGQECWGIQCAARPAGTPMTPTRVFRFPITEASTTRLQHTVFSNGSVAISKERSKGRTQYQKQSFKESQSSLPPKSECNHVTANTTRIRHWPSSPNT